MMASTVKNGNDRLRKGNRRRAGGGAGFRHLGFSCGHRGKLRAENQVHGNKRTKNVSILLFSTSLIGLTTSCPLTCCLPSPATSLLLPILWRCQKQSNLNQTITRHLFTKVGVAFASTYSGG